MLAARLADLLAADPDPAVARGVGDHPLDQRPLLLLDLGPARDSLRIDDPVAGARAAVRALSAERVDAIVALSHLGRAGGEALAADVGGIDVLVAGRDVPLLPEGRTLGRATAAYAGDRGYAVGLSTLTFGASGRILAARSRSVPLGPEVRDRADIAAGLARTSAPETRPPANEGRLERTAGR